MTGKAKNISTDKLADLLAKDEVVLIDIRQPSEYLSLSIKGSINIPSRKLSKDTLPNLGKKKSVLLCQSGARSVLVCQQLPASSI